MIYLASPYSSEDPVVRKQRYNVVADYTAKQMARGFHIFSPIFYGHQLSEDYNLPTDAAYWWKFNREFLAASAEFHILIMPGWQQSVGIKQELEFAQAIGLPVMRVYPNG